MDAAADRANASIFWKRKKSLAVIDSGNYLADGIGEFHVTPGSSLDRLTAAELDSA